MLAKLQEILSTLESVGAGIGVLDQVVIPGEFGSKLDELLVATIGTLEGRSTGDTKTRLLGLATGGKQSLEDQLRNLQAANSRRHSALEAAKSKTSDLSSKRTKLLEAKTAQEGAEDERKKAEQAFTAAQNAYTSAEGDRDNLEADGKTFFDSLKHGFSEANSAQAKPHQFDVEKLEEIIKDVVAQIYKDLTEIRSGKEVINDEEARKLSKILSNGIKDSHFNVRTDAAVRTIKRLMPEVLKDYVSLVKSDDPMLTAVIKSSKLKFTNQDLRKLAIGSIPASFKKQLEKQASGESDVKAAMEAALNEPGNSYLFGLGVVNTSVTEAFKSEFYNAFKNRLAETVEKEREADYDYWWLTFYPKAIPTGNNRFDGESLIELEFPETVVPQDQYHR